jgi:Rrf2 family protein
MAQEQNELRSVNFLSKHLSIPYKYLARLMTQLNHAELISSTKGKRGGYIIAKPLDQIKISDIVSSVEGLENYHRCVLGFKECSEENSCCMHHLWETHIIGIREMIYENTLADLRDKSKKEILNPDQESQN